MRIARMPCVLVARFSGLPGDSTLQGIRNLYIYIYIYMYIRARSVVPPGFFLPLSPPRIETYGGTRVVAVPVPAAYFAGLTVARPVYFAPFHRRTFVPSFSFSSFRASVGTPTS